MKKRSLKKLALKKKTIGALNSESVQAGANGSWTWVTITFPKTLIPTAMFCDPQPSDNCA